MEINIETLNIDDEKVKKLGNINIPVLKGEKGDTGPQGPQGVKGDTGETGIQGPQGEVGPQGPQGAQGETGPQGPQGEIGPQGPQGEVGPQGVKGDTGEQGLQGIQGPRGDKGDKGDQGIQGPKGDTGATGPQGPQGEVGPQGPKGDTGPQGEAGKDGTGVNILGNYNSYEELIAENPTGELGQAYMVEGVLYVWSIKDNEWVSAGNIKGPKGDKGDKGDQGIQGPKGDTGATGPQGPQGEKGEDGFVGEDGVTFTPNVDSNGNLSWSNNKGLTNPATINIKGPQGEAGPQGSQGETGPQGPQGPQGEAGTTTYSDLSDKPTIDGVIIEGNLTSNELFKSFKNALLNEIYPIGSVFIDESVDENGNSTDYSNRFGFKWERTLMGLEPVGINPDDKDEINNFSKIGNTGGSKTHTQTIEEMADHTHLQDAHTHTQNSHNHSQNAHTHTQNAHSHGQTFNNDGGSSYPSDWIMSGGSGGSRSTQYTWGATATNQNTTATNIATTATNQSTTATNQNAGGGQPMNIMGPYGVVAFWKRVE